MSNISIANAVSVAQNISGAMPDSRILAAHRALDDEIDKANDGTISVASETIRAWKIWRVELKSAIQRRGLESSKPPAQVLPFQHQGATA